jgi:hypothetical protein
MNPTTAPIINTYTDAATTIPGGTVLAIVLLALLAVGVPVLRHLLDR